MENIQDKIKKLEEAKKAVLLCLENSNILVDMHGLAYWAEVVEMLRKDIKKQL